MPQIRTKQELDRALWAEKFASVTQGKLYTTDLNSPFPIHEYIKLGLVGKQARMLEVNAGTALVETMVADTMTDLGVQIGDDSSDALEQAFRDWMEQEELQDKLEGAMRDWYGVGYGVQQAFRIVDDNLVTVASVDPSMWYPTIPTFNWQKISGGRIISVFPQDDDKKINWYAFVEEQSVGRIEYGLYKLDHADSLEGSAVSLQSLSQFADMQDVVQTDLDTLAVSQQDRQKSTGFVMGKSVLAPIWDILQEVSEIQTQIRHERIKHGRAKLAAPMRSLQRVETSGKETPVNFKTEGQRDLTGMGALFNPNQEVFPIPEGSTVIPQYIIRDLSFIEKASAEIDNLLSRAASIVGAPRSVFNLDDKGQIHVDTDRRKDRRYVRQVIQGQRAAGNFVRFAYRVWWKWTQPGEEQPITVKFSSPFDLSQKEKVELYRIMNADVPFISQHEAVKNLFPEKKPQEIDALLAEMKDEQPTLNPTQNPNSLFNKSPKVTL